MLELLFKDKEYAELFKNISAESSLLDTVINVSMRIPSCLGPNQGYDQDFDWRSRNGDNYVLPPEDQGGYGICYAMASASVAESVLAIEENTPYGEGMQNLSQSFIAFFGQFRGFGNPYLWYEIRGDSGCIYPYEEAVKRLCYNGIVAEDDFPWDPNFSSPSDTVFSSMGCDRHRFTTWSSVGSGKTQIKDALEDGPVWAAMTYDSITHYGYDGGILKNPGNGPNHAVAIVGWGYDELDQCEYWIVKNSYGANWGGELGNGYMLVATSNALDIQDYVYKVSYLPVEIDGVDLAYEDQEITNVPEGDKFIHYRPDPYTLFNGYTSSSQWTSGSTTNLSPKNTINGEATVIFRVNYSNNSVSFPPIDLDTLVYYEKLVWAGKPLPPAVWGPTSIDCYSPEWYYAWSESTNGLATAESYSWSVSNGLQILNTYNTPPRIRVRATSAGNHTITCYATNDIGTDTTYFFVNCPICYCLAFSAFPNPASDQLTVSIDDSGNIVADYQIDLIDSSNRKWKSTSTKSKSTVFSVDDVPQGTYLLKVTAKRKGGKIEEKSKTILIIK